MIEVYTDGSCLHNPGPGGWAAVCKGKFTLKGGFHASTNNIMEMTAVVKALEECKKIGEKDVTIYTDSNYVKLGITQWIHKWKTNGWKTSAGKPVANMQLWIKMDTLSQQLNVVEWRWVKAHNGNPMNELVDKLARECATSIAEDSRPQGHLRGLGN